MTAAWDDPLAQPERAPLVERLLEAIVDASGAPISDADLLSQATHHLEGAWAEFDRAELRSALTAAATAGRFERLAGKRVMSFDPPVDLDEIFDRTVAITAAAEAVAVLESDPIDPSPPTLAPSLFARPVLTPEAERRLALKARRGNRDAMNLLVEHNLRLAATACNRSLTTPGLDYEDQLQEAVLGLIRASEKFDVKLGFKFSTYGSSWIHQAIARATADKSRTVRLPVHIVERLNVIRRATGKLERELGRPPTVEEIGSVTGFAPEDIEKINRAARPTVELEYAEQVPDLIGADPETLVLEASQRGEVEYWLSKLDPREAQVLRARAGLDTGEPLTLDAVGRQLRVTRERIRQIETSAYKRIREVAQAEKQGKRFNPVWARSAPRAAWKVRPITEDGGAAPVVRHSSPAPTLGRASEPGWSQANRARHRTDDAPSIQQAEREPSRSPDDRVAEIVRVERVPGEPHLTRAMVNWSSGSFGEAVRWLGASFGRDPESLVGMTAAEAALLSGTVKSARTLTVNAH